MLFHIFKVFRLVLLLLLLLLVLLLPIIYQLKPLITPICLVNLLIAKLIYLILVMANMN